MADALAFYRTMNSQIGQLVNILQQLETVQDRISGLILGWAQRQQLHPGRHDLATIDFTNAASAIRQVLFAFNSGSPTQKSYLYKIL